MKKQIFSKTNIQIIAILTMILDHAAIFFLKEETALYILFRGIGRISFPLFAFLISEGYYKTSNKKNYFIRLSILTLISIIPFYLLTESFKMNTIYTLLIGFSGLMVYKEIKNFDLKIILLILISFLSFFGDYSLLGFLLIFSLGIFHDNKKIQLLCFLIFTSIYLVISYATNYLFMFLIFPIIYFYNPKKKPNKKINRLFYIIYPLHIMIFYFIKILFIS